VNMALFSTDLEASIYIVLITIILILINNLVSFLLKKLKSVSIKYRTIAKFVLRLASIISIIYLIIEGLPSFTSIDPTYQAILTGSISTAIAFASSGIFSNLISGIILLILRPFDVGDLVKINNDKGIIRSVNLTRIVMETFDYIIIQKSNSTVISSPIVNYTIKLGKLKNFQEFQKKINAPLDEGIIDMFSRSPDEQKLDYEKDLQLLYDKISKKRAHNIYVYSFVMDFPYVRFRIILDQVEDLCREYREKYIFGLKPRYNVLSFGFKIQLKIRILSLNSDKIFDHQSQFANDLNKIIYANKMN